jgi:hypothetical protein
MDTVLLKIPEVMVRLAIGQTKVHELMSTGAPLGQGRPFAAAGRAG